MSTSVFSPCDGAVYRSKFTCTPPGGSGGGIFSIKIDNSPITVPVTGFTLDLNTNHQFLHTLNEFIYVHVFGDRVGELTVSGIGFLMNCDSGDAGICGIFRDYQTGRLSVSKRGFPIALGTCGTFWAFMTGLRIDMSRPDIMVAQWSVRFHIIQPVTASFVGDVNPGGGTVV